MFFVSFSGRTYFRTIFSDRDHPRYSLLPYRSIMLPSNDRETLWELWCEILVTTFLFSDDVIEI